MQMKRVLPLAAVFAVAATAMTMRTAVAAPVPPVTAHVPALDDATIVAIFDAANGFDIATGNLAAEKGSTKEVRDFGKMIAHDHTVVRQQGRDLAKKLGVKPTAPAEMPFKADHDATMKELRGLKGVEFDKAFLAHEVKYHNDVLDAVKTTLMPAIQNAELKDLVTKVAPAFVAHRDAAQNLLNKIK